MLRRMFTGLAGVVGSVLIITGTAAWAGVSTLTIGGTSAVASAGIGGIHPGPRATCPICNALDRTDALAPTLIQQPAFQSMYRQVYLAPEGTVVYMPISLPPQPSNDPMLVISQPTVVMLRLQSSGHRRPPEVLIVTPGTVTSSRWQRAAAALQADDAAGTRSVVRKSLFGDAQFNDGNRVYFFDATGMHANPPTLGLKTATNVSDLDFAAARARREALESATEDPASYRAFLAFPHDQATTDMVSGNRTTASGAEWSATHDAFAKTAKDDGIDFVGPDRLKDWTTKEQAMAEFESTDNIILITCHGAEGEMILPGEKAIKLTVEDIKQMKLKNKPFVFLRVCEDGPADNESFAKAFIDAGARGVNVNTGKIQAAHALEDLSTFVKALKETKSVMRAFEKMSEEQQMRSKTITRLFPQNITDEPMSGIINLM